MNELFNKHRNRKLHILQLDDGSNFFPESFANKIIFTSVLKIKMIAKFNNNIYEVMPIEALLERMKGSGYFRGISQRHRLRMIAMSVSVRSFISF